MREVTKDEFKRIYFTLGRGRGGWDAEYWKHTFDAAARPGMKFMVEDPVTPAHTAMWIVSDYAVNEYRLFFRTDDESDTMLEFPDTER